MLTIKLEKNKLSYRIAISFEFEGFLEYRKFRRCGFTGQYTGLEKLFGTYAEQGFVVLVFPANNFMTAKETNPNFGGAISWNFNKFLIGRDGAIGRRFGSRTKPEDQELIAAVEQALKASN